MLSSLQQHILYPSYCPMHELNVAFSEMAPGRFPTAGYAYIGFMSFRGWRYNHYHTLPHEWKCLCTVYIYTYIIYIYWNTLHMPFICFFHAFSPHLRGVNDLCRFLHELLHALDGRTLFSKRKGCWHQGQREMSKLQVISFHFTSYHLVVSHRLSFHVIFIMFHLLSDAIWCRCALPCAHRFMWVHALCQCDIGSLGAWTSQFRFPALMGFLFGRELPKSFKESLVCPSPYQFWRQFNTSGRRSYWYHVKSMLFNKYLFVTYDIITFHKLFTFHIQVYHVCVQIYFQKYQIRMVSSCRQGDLALLQLLWNATLNLATPWFSQLTTGRWTPVSWINSVPPGACVMVFCISSFTTSRKSPMAWQGPKSGHPLLFSPGFVEKHGLFR